MNILVNGQPFVPDTTPATMSELFDMIHERDLNEQGIISQVLLDGELIEFPEPDEAFPPYGFTGRTIEIVVEQGQAIISRAVADGLELLRMLQEEMIRCVEQFRLGELETGNEMLGMVLDKLHVFLEYVTEVMQFSKNLLEPAPDERRMQELGGRTAEQIGALFASQESSDYVLLSDILEFEMAPLLQQWQQALESSFHFSE